MSDPVSYTAMLPIGESTVAFVSGVLAGERRRRGTRRGRRALGWYRRAILVLCWFLDAPRIAELAVDNQVSSSTAYRYLHEGIDVLAAAAPSLHGALLAARPGTAPVRAQCSSRSSWAQRAQAVQPRRRRTALGHRHRGQVVTAPDTAGPDLGPTASDTALVADSTNESPPNPGRFTMAS